MLQIFTLAFHDSVSLSFDALLCNITWNAIIQKYNYFPLLYKVHQPATGSTGMFWAQR